jgi:serine/threonine protein phosphatase PrpC
VVEKFLHGSESSEIRLFLVLDGHGGSGIAEYSMNVLPRKIAEALERLIVAKGTSKGG